MGFRGKGTRLSLFRPFGFGHPRTQPHPHPRHRQSFFRYLFPRTVRERYRERLLSFHLDTFPRFKHNVQSRIYRYIVERQRRRAEQSRALDIVARQGRRLWQGPQARTSKHVKARPQGLVARNPSAGEEGMSSYGTGRLSTPGDRERGFRRKRLAPMANNLYRSGQAAVTEIRESYAQTRVQGQEGGFETHGPIHIPGAFPDVAITHKGDSQMVLFPSYAKRHTKRDWDQVAIDQAQSTSGTLRDEDFWRQEWEKNEDERAIIDVDVRGWVYSPHSGPMTRRNRMLVGLARQLSGIPLPRTDQPANQGQDFATTEDWREQEKIDQEAARIERQGQREKQVAYQGGYSERPQESQSGDMDSFDASRSRSGNQSPRSIPSSPPMKARALPAAGTELSEAELSLANANLMARISPFMTNPMVALPITLFFYNDVKSQSKTVLTNDAGHFNMRAALDFIPTHVRVLATEDLSATQDVKITEPYGVSLISDIDDTVKKSNISGGAKEIFRNTFVRELSELTVDGVREWFGRLHDLGVSFHYCSNSPWQLFPVLASFFKHVGLPPGSLHLKQYSGMLQGIFEPVAERKKSTLSRLLRDFPERRFLLVGDSGEADLEVYTELAQANPGRILAVFIRDVTTPEETGYFDSGFDLNSRKSSNAGLDDRGSYQQSQNSERRPSAGPVMGNLIDLSEQRSAAPSPPSYPKPSSSTSDLHSGRKPAPPRPAKPAALRSAKSITELNKGVTGLGISRHNSDEIPPPLPRRPGATTSRESAATHPLSQIQNSSQQTIANRNAQGNAAPPPPPPRRRGTPSNSAPSNAGNLSPRFMPRRTQTSNSDVDYDPLPPPSTLTPSFGSSRAPTRSGATSPSGSPTFGAVNKKLELWRRRLARAHEQLDELGVSLYTWKKGSDVMVEAEAIVKRAMAEMDRNRRR